MLVGQVTATDRDEPNTLHSTISYRIVSQSGQMYHVSEAFGIHPDSGSITVLSPNLDREVTVHAFHIYLYTVFVIDMTRGTYYL